MPCNILQNFTAKCPKKCPVCSNKQYFQIAWQPFCNYSGSSCEQTPSGCEKLELAAYGNVIIQSLIVWELKINNRVLWRPGCKYGVELSAYERVSISRASTVFQTAKVQLWKKVEPGALPLSHVLFLKSTLNERKFLPPRKIPWVAKPGKNFAPACHFFAWVPLQSYYM